MQSKVLRLKERMFFQVSGMDTKTCTIRSVGAYYYWNGSHTLRSINALKTVGWKRNDLHVEPLSSACISHTVRTLTHSDVASIPSRATSGLVMHSIEHCWDLKWDATEGFCSGHCAQHSGIQQQQSCKKIQLFTCCVNTPPYGFPKKLLTVLACV